ncbi:hypothetical protein TBCH5v1_0964 [Thermococcus barophilus]|uniref:Uncharacterized protein n=1 Tax=Thermococcus barophilus TaxID=55802 RepID=A0A0S1XAU0_THEBA|nr:hypothetical protein TBCH5v1_0964 [Thermococcus barophilus]
MVNSFFFHISILWLSAVEDETMEAVKMFHFVEYGEFPIEEIPVEEVEEDALLWSLCRKNCR